MSQLVEIGNFPIRFQCQPGCTACCTQQGEVYLTDEDVRRIAKSLGLSRRSFEERYVKHESKDILLTTPPDRDCHFLEEGGCSIHSVKPVQCVTFPFWPDHVKTKRSWKALRSYCPGVGVGPPLEREDVRRQAQECADAFPDG